MINMAREGRVWRQDRPNNDEPTPFSLVTMAEDLVDCRGPYKLIIKHAKGIRGLGFVPYVKGIMPESDRRGTVYYGTNQQTYMEAVDEGLKLLRQCAAEVDTPKAFNIIAEFLRCFRKIKILASEPLNWKRLSSEIQFMLERVSWLAKK